MSPEVAQLQQEIATLRHTASLLQRQINLIRPHLFQDEEASAVTTPTGEAVQPAIVTISDKVSGSPGKYKTAAGAEVWNEPELSLAPAAHLLDVNGRAYIGFVETATGRAHISELPIGATASPKTVGDSTEGSEAVESTTWARGSDAKGIDLWMTCRVGYFDAGNEKLYGYARKLSFDALGLLVAVTGETRYEIDTPGSCP